MKRALDILLYAELALGVLWTVSAAMAQGAGGLAVFGLFLIVYGLFAVFVLCAAWACWRYPELRRKAVWIMLLPIGFWFLPGVVRALAGGVLLKTQLVALLLAALLAAVALCWLKPRTAARIVPAALQARVPGPRSRTRSCWARCISSVWVWAPSARRPGPG